MSKCGSNDNPYKISVHLYETRNPKRALKNSFRACRGEIKMAVAYTDVIELLQCSIKCAYPYSTAQLNNAHA